MSTEKTEKTSISKTVFDVTNDKGYLNAAYGFSIYSGSINSVSFTVCDAFGSRENALNLFFKKTGQLMNIKEVFEACLSLWTDEKENSSPKLKDNSEFIIKLSQNENNFLLISYNPYADKLMIDYSKEIKEGKKSITESFELIFEKETSSENYGASIIKSDGTSTGSRSPLYIIEGLLNVLNNIIDLKMMRRYSPPSISIQESGRGGSSNSSVNSMIAKRRNEIRDKSTDDNEDEDEENEVPTSNSVRDRMNKSKASSKTTSRKSDEFEDD
jgi:hypothetical protein